MRPQSEEILDVVVIGGGISGVISLYWAKKRGLRAHLVEKAPDVGGIWRTLPTWQDIQMQAGEWTLNGLPIAGTNQGAIVDNIRSWISSNQMGFLTSLEHACFTSKF